MSEAAIRVVDAHLSYEGGEDVLRGASLEVARGEMHVLLGESGSGKTTLLRAIAGFESLGAGAIEVAGTVVDGGPKGIWLPPEKRGVGVVFQDYALFPHLDVLGNVRFSGASVKRAKDLLDAVDLVDCHDRSVGELSGGQQQRVALARALAQNPQVILLDEPFSNLNQGLRHRLREMTLSVLRASGSAALFVTHDRDEAMALGDRLSVVDDGRILQSGSPHDVYRSPSSWRVASALGEANRIEVVASGDDYRCALGPLRVGASTGRFAVVRPDEIEVGAEGVEAEVIATTFLGSHYRLVTLVAGERFVVHCAFAPKPGTKVRLSVSGQVALVAD